MLASLYVSCVSLVSAVGLTPASASAAMRAGISGFTELQFHDVQGEPIIGAAVPGFPEDLRGRARLIELLIRAFEFGEERLSGDFNLEELPILLCTREPHRPGGRVNRIASEIESRLGCKFRRDGSGHFAYGHTACYAALSHAEQMLATQRSSAYLIAAADSLLDARTLRWLDDAQRLKTSAQTDGLTPGEAACLVLVSDHPLTDSPYAVKGLGFGTETATVLNEEPLLGKGMAAAVRMALDSAAVAMHEVNFRLSDVGGESYAFEELVLAQTRVTLKTRRSQPVWMPASSIGDCGAATALVEMAWAEQAYLLEYAPGPLALMHGSTADGARAAAVVGI
jgi:3-oxoacyl-[acyl-carrier-protein] synthase-1